jgi:hypothetical protein
MSSMNKRARAAVKLSIAIAGACLLAWKAAPNAALILSGHNDFPSFYTAGDMVGTGKLYDPDAFLARELALVGAFNNHILFVRLPFVAAFFRPFALLPYTAAYWTWQAICLAAFLAFILLWPEARRWYPALFFLPALAASFANGQDVPLILLWIALAVLLAAKDQPFAAGLALSLCLAKPHFFLLTPIVLLAQKRWRLAAGAATGAAALIAISFAAAGGPGWISGLLRIWQDPAIHPAIDESSLIARLAGTAGDAIPRSVIMLGIPALSAAVIWIVARRTDFALALSAAIAAGVASAFHVYSQDYLLVAPLGLILLERLDPAR